MDETKEKILAAATRLFARRGLDGVTIREICREAGVKVTRTASMKELGRACAISVGAACAAFVR